MIVYVRVGQVLLGMGDLLLSVIYIRNEMPLKKNNFPFLSFCQLEIASWFRMGDHAHFPTLSIGPRLA